MLDWIFEGIVKWISSIVSQLMDAVSGLFLNTLNTDLTAMEEYFPFVTKAFDVMQYMAWAILFLITVWQLFRVFGGPITEAENPLTLLARSSLFALLIGYAKPIFLIALDIARAPYTALYEGTYFPEHMENAGRASYVERNQEMIYHSKFCVVYYDENYLPPRRKNSRRDLFDYQPKSGTAVAYDYAVKKKKEIINGLV